ncbi:MAG TPA: PadR family transcriptional regulator [Chloroflexota bacterium]|nr:PadR family transcriptional regulator [Chloroflexota bacterium]
MIAAHPYHPYHRRRGLKFAPLALALVAFARHHGGGPPFGGRGPWGFGPPRGGRRFGRGDLKYVILDLLQDGPRHGYDIIRALEERFHGFYSPSAGSVYPTLQLLEDQGFVTSREQDGKRVYTITDEGRAFLRERADTMEDVRSRMAEWWGPALTPELRGLAEEVRHIGQTLFSEAAAGGFRDAEKLRRVREVIARAGGEIEAIVRDQPTSRDDMV